ARATEPAAAVREGLLRRAEHAPARGHGRARRNRRGRGGHGASGGRPGTVRRLEARRHARARTDYREVARARRRTGRGLMLRLLMTLLLTTAALGPAAATAAAGDVVWGVNDDAGKYGGGASTVWTTVHGGGVAAVTMTV